MTSKEKAALVAHAGHEVVISDYMTGEPIRDSDGDGRFCLECVECGEILLGARTMVGSALSVSISYDQRDPSTGVGMDG